MFFKKKKSKSELQSAVDNIGMEMVCRKCATLISPKLTTPRIYKQFVLEELDSARQGNNAAKTFTRKMADRLGLKDEDYAGSLDRSFPEVDGAGGPQQTLILMAMQLQPDMDQVVEFRTRVVELLVDKHGAVNASA